MNNRKKIPFILVGLLYAFLVLGLLSGFWATGAIISYLFDLNLYWVLGIEAVLVIALTWAILDYVSNFDELDITFSDPEDKDDLIL